MMIIHLKTIPKKGVEQRYAPLIEPEFIPTPKMSPADCDKNLNLAIKEHGSVTFHEFEVTNPFQLKRSCTVMTPEEFEKEWMGD